MKYRIMQIRKGASRGYEQLRPWIVRRTMMYLPEEFDPDSNELNDVQHELEARFNDKNFLNIFKILLGDNIIFSSIKDLEMEVDE